MKEIREKKFKPVTKNVAIAVCILVCYTVQVPYVKKA